MPGSPFIRLLRSGHTKTYLYQSNWILIRQFLEPSQTLDWQALPAPSNCRFACGKTGGAFVATAGSFGFCPNPSIMGPKPKRSRPRHRVSQLNLSLPASYYRPKRNPPNPWGSGGFQVFCSRRGCLRFVFWCCNRAFVVVIRGSATDIVEQFCNLKFCRCFFFSCQFLD